MGETNRKAGGGEGQQVGGKMATVGTFLLSAGRRREVGRQGGEGDMHGDAKRGLGSDGGRGAQQGRGGGFVSAGGRGARPQPH